MAEQGLPEDGSVDNTNPPGPPEPLPHKRGGGSDSALKVPLAPRSEGEGDVGGAGQKKIVVLASGGGTNLQALIDAAEAGHLPATIAAVIVNRKDAYALTRAANHGIPSLYVPLKPYRDAGQSREEYDADLTAKVAAFAPDLIVLAGWMHLFSPVFVDTFKGRVINLHPALPGKFDGTQAIERTFEAYQRGEVDRGGCMVHEVIHEMDAGPVIASAEVAILPDDTLDTFAARLHAAEHQLIVQAAILALGRQ